MQTLIAAETVALLCVTRRLNPLLVGKGWEGSKKQRQLGAVGFEISEFGLVTKC